jgi:Ca-activated chloride channel family protein
LQFINLLDDGDRLQVVAFSTSVNTIVQLAPVGVQRDAVIRRVSGIVEGGNTQLYGATLAAYNDLKAQSNARHIRAVVVLSDGQDNASKLTLDQLVAQISASGEDSGDAIKLFTIAFGKDADKDILTRMAESTGGKMYEGDPKNINQVYAEIATFF